MYVCRYLQKDVTEKESSPPGGFQLFCALMVTENQRRLWHFVAAELLTADPAPSSHKHTRT